MGVSKNNGTPKSSILIGFSITNHPYWGGFPLFLATSISTMHHGPFGKVLGSQVPMVCSFHTCQVKMSSDQVHPGWLGDFFRGMKSYPVI